MREIKFRAWRAEAGHMHPHVGVFPTTCKYPWSISSDGIMVNPSMEDKFILMQFTGLHDKDGKEIYEGDIFDYGFGRVGRVVWNERGFCGAIGKAEPNLMINPSHYEVIGNVHENRELLEGGRE